MQNDSILKKSTLDFLDLLVSVPSVSRHEEKIARMIADRFSALGCRVRKLPMHDSILNDPAASTVFAPEDRRDYDGRYNIEITMPGRTNRNIAFNAHMDTVPPAENMKTGLEDGRFYGRGTSDDKGQIAGLFYMLSKLVTHNEVPESSITAHLVVEEEIGGNGSLSLDIPPGTYDGAVVLEPTSLKIYSAARGVVWFKVTTHGTSGHSADTTNTRSALLMAARAITIIQGYHAQQKKKFEGKPPFEAYEISLCFGKLHSGEWPATVPEKAVLEGIMGVFPGMSSDTVSIEIREVLDGSELAGAVEVEFTFKRDPNVTDRSHWLVRGMASACRKAGIAPQFDVMPACCDTFFYARKGVPVVIFGAGSLKSAHSANEYVELDDVYALGETLYNLVRQKNIGM